MAEVIAPSPAVERQVEDPRRELQNEQLGNEGPRSMSGIGLNWYSTREVSPLGNALDAADRHRAPSQNAEMVAFAPMMRVIAEILEEVIASSPHGASMTNQMAKQLVQRAKDAKPHDMGTVTSELESQMTILKLLERDGHLSHRAAAQLEIAFKALHDFLVKGLG